MAFEDIALSCGTWWVVLSGQDTCSSTLPARVANHIAGFDSSCQLPELAILINFTVTVPLFTQVYIWVPANLMLGVPCDGLASCPQGGVENTPSCLMPRKLGQTTAW